MLNLAAMLARVLRVPNSNIWMETEVVQTVYQSNANVHASPKSPAVMKYPRRLARWT